MLASPGRQWPWPWYLLVAASLAAIFVVPELFPPTRPSDGPSYVFGYNNRLGLLLTLLLTAACAWMTRGFGLPLFELRDPSPGIASDAALSRRTLARALLLTTFGCFVLWLVTHGTGGFNESADLLDRIFLLSRGRVPYRDFEYAYGAALLYVPLWISRGLHLSVVNAYYVWWTANCLAGCAMVYRVLGLLRAPSRHTRAIFWAYTWFQVSILTSCGLNYTYFRYATGPWLALEAHRLTRQSEHGSGNGRAAAVLLWIAGTLATLLISPEMGVAFAAGSLLWLAVGVRRWTAGHAALFAAVLAADALLLLAASRFHYFELMTAMSGGASNNPVVPALHLLVLFTCLGACAAWLIGRLFPHASSPAAAQPGRDWADPVSALILVSVPTLASALGRCDPGHVFLGALGLLLPGLAILATTRAWRPVWTAFLLAFFLLPLVAGRALVPLLGKAVAIQLFSQPGDSFANRLLTGTANRVLGPEKAATKLAHARADATFRGTVDFDHLYPGASPVLAAPYAYQPNGFAAYQSPRVDEGRYFGLENVLTPPQVQAKIDELAQDPERDLLLPPALPACALDAGGALHELREVMAFPYRRRVLHPEQIRAPLCQYILQNYQPAYPATAANFNYTLWKHR